MASEKPERYVCVYCGKTIERTRVDPCACIVAAEWERTGFDGETGQYWFQSSCFKDRVHPSVHAYFLDAVEES
jgi:hypothetical protein